MAVNVEVVKKCDGDQYNTRLKPSFETVWMKFWERAFFSKYKIWQKNRGWPQYSYFFEFVATFHHVTSVKYKMMHPCEPRFLEQNIQVLNSANEWIFNFLWVFVIFDFFIFSTTVRTAQILHRFRKFFNRWKIETLGFLSVPISGLYDASKCFYEAIEIFTKKYKKSGLALNCNFYSNFSANFFLIKFCIFLNFYENFNRLIQCIFTHHTDLRPAPIERLECQFSIGEIIFEIGEVIGPKLSKFQKKMKISH